MTLRSPKKAIDRTLALKNGVINPIIRGTLINFKRSVTSNTTDTTGIFLICTCSAQRTMNASNFLFDLKRAVWDNFTETAFQTF